MNYFQNIKSLADLKKQYRVLALAHHPDRGGNTAVMQAINLQFEELYPVWVLNESESKTVTGYEDDYSGASAKEYAAYVDNEYRWRGSNYRGQSNREIIEIIRVWLKETYPRYRFSARRRDYYSFFIYLLNADFIAFTPQAENIVYSEFNYYRHAGNEHLTDRAKEVMFNVYQFIKSYHFDYSDSMTDYFNTNFYLHLGVGSDTHPYKIVTPKLKGRKSDTVPQFRHPEGQAHKAIRQALGRNKFAEYPSCGYGAITVLGYDTFYKNGKTDFYPLWYSSEKRAQNRIDKMLAAGVKCRLTGRICGYIRFSGYTEETERALEKERREAEQAIKEWNQKHPENQSEITIEKHFISEYK
jgi:hypothetical protein